VGGLRKGSLSSRYNVALDIAVVVVVAVLSIAVNIVLAVFIGVAIAIALFVLRMSRSVIRRTYRCSAIHSRTSRTESERAFLERAGDAILVMELQGALFFGTGEKMLSEVESALRCETSCVILDLRRLTEIDSTGANALLELKTSLAQQRKELWLVVAQQTMAMERLEHFGVLSSIRSGGNRAVLAARVLPTGQRDLSRRRSRSASAYLQLPNTNIRLATFATGTMFGELALLDAGARSATVVADADLVCYTLTTSDFAAMAAKFPGVAVRLLAAIGRELSGRLRTANRTIHHLET
jgi:SulP family sulfate permease